MDNDNLGGEKALLEERRKKLDQLRDKGSAYGNTFKPQNSAKKLQEELTDRDFDPLRTCILSVLRAVQVSCGEFQIAIELCDLERILRFGCC